MNDSRHLTRWLMQQAGPARRCWIFASVAGIISAVGYILFARQVSAFTGALLNHKNGNNDYLLKAAFFLLCRALAQYLYVIFNLRAGEKIAAKIREQLFPLLLRSVWIESATGTFYFTESVKRLTPFYSRYIPAAVQAVTVPFFILLFIFPLNWIVASILLLAYLFIPLQMIAAGIGAENIHKRQIDIVTILSGLFQDRIHAMPSIKRLGRVKEETNRIKITATALNHATMTMMKVAMLSSALMEFFSTFAVAIVAIYIGMGLLKYIHWGFPPQGIELNDALFMLMLAPYFFLPLRKFAAAYHDRNDAIAAAQQIIPVFETEIITATRIKSTKGLEHIFLRELSFHYPQSTINAVNQISLQLPGRGITLLSGPSGSGKSTLLLLLSGYLKPVSGDVVINDQTIAESINWLREKSCWMGQNTFLFRGTIEENIQLNSTAAIDKELLSREACLENIIQNKADGWKSVLQENGFGLSGGEKQRIGLARLLHHRKPLLLLDEPTAHVDANTAATIFKVLRKLSADHCIVLASHHAAAFDIADRIIHLEEGSVISISNREQVYQETESQIGHVAFL